MAESSLSLTFWDLVTRVSDVLGLGPSSERQSTFGQGFVAGGDNFRRIRRYIDDGYRMFLFPPPLVQGAAGHAWSFLGAHGATLGISAAGGWQVDLPDDFGMLMGDVAYSEAGGKMTKGLSPRRIRRVSPETIYELRATQPASGDDPEYVAVAPKSFTASTGQRWQALFYPTPNATKTLVYRYQTRPAKLSASLVTGWGEIKSSTTLEDTDASPNFTAAGVTVNCRVVTFNTGDIYVVESTYLVTAVPSATTLTLMTSPGDGPCGYEVYPATRYPVGGPEHNDTLLEACLAAAEMAQNDSMNGPHYQRFLHLLQGSIARDIVAGGGEVREAAAPEKAANG